MREFWSDVEAKVKSAAFAALAASVVTALLNALVGNSKLLGSLPPFWQFVIVTVAPPVLTFVAGWKTRHTAKPPASVAKAIKQ